MGWMRGMPEEKLWSQKNLAKEFSITVQTPGPNHFFVIAQARSGRFSMES